MNLKKNYIVLVFVLCIMFFFSTNVSYAGTQRWNSLDYDVTITSDGDMEVVETWDVYISDTNTMFKTFEDTYHDYYEIGDVKVSQVINGNEVFLNDVQMQQYHVDPGGYYGLRINSFEFEIAWNVGLEGSSDTRTYKMYYTVKDAVKKYNDCNEIYWKFLSANNTMTGNNITGRIILPSPVSSEEALRVWGHGNLTAEIHKNGKQIIEFSQPEIERNEMFEVRVVVEDNIFGILTNTYTTNKLQEIIDEETIWANEANKEREEAKKYIERLRNIISVIVILNIFGLFFFINKANNYRKIREELIREYSQDDNVLEMEYFRDIPHENEATPARAVFLKNFRKNSTNINADLSKIFSATILNLCLKGILNFEAVNEKEVRIFINNEGLSKESSLPEDEKIIFNLIKRASRNKEYITTKDFNRFASRQYDLFYDQMRKIENLVELELIQNGTISREKNAKMKIWQNKQNIFLVTGIASFFFLTILPFLFCVPIGLIILGVSARKNATCFSILSNEGQEEVFMWNGLKKFMEDYSMLDERLVPDIVLWEKYLVYATAFGIAGKVIKQLKVVHPEMFARTDDYYGRSRYGYWNMVSSPYYNDNFFESFSKDLGNVYNKAVSSYSVAHSSSSSGSGGGGGFSGGGGGGGGGGSCGGR